MYGPNPQAYRPRLIPGPGQSNGGGYTQYGRRNDWYTPYLNMVYPPGFGSGFGDVQQTQNQRRGALDWLIPQGFLGHQSNLDAFGRPIPGAPGPGQTSLGPGRPNTTQIGWNDPRNMNNPANQPPIANPAIGQGFGMPGRGFDRANIRANIGKYRMR
jgi:hypothetical protein